MDRREGENCERAGPRVAVQPGAFAMIPPAESSNSSEFRIYSTFAPSRPCVLALKFRVFRAQNKLFTAIIGTLTKAFALFVSPDIRVNSCPFVVESLPSVISVPSC
jgi:hypothetical protein